MNFFYYGIATLTIIIFSGWSFGRYKAGFWSHLDLSSLSPQDSYYLFALVAALIGLGAVAGGLLRSQGRIYYTAKIAVLLFFTAIIALFIYSDGDRNSALVFAGIGLAAVGWIVQSNGSQVLQRRQHTLTILTELRQCPHFIESMRLFSHHCPPGSQLTIAQGNKLCDLGNTVATYERPDPVAKDDTISEQYRALVFILNYYEFLAAGVEVEDIDVALLERSHDGVMVGVYTRALAFIRGQWDGQEQPPDDNATYYYLWKLIERVWKKEVPEPPDDDLSKAAKPPVKKSDKT